MLNSLLFTLFGPWVEREERKVVEDLCHQSHQEADQTILVVSGDISFPFTRAVTIFKRLPPAWASKYRWKHIIAHSTDDLCEAIKQCHQKIALLWFQGHGFSNAIKFATQNNFLACRSGHLVSICDGKGVVCDAAAADCASAFDDRSLVVLESCSTGQQQNGIASTLAALWKVNVVAPTIEVDDKCVSITPEKEGLEIHFVDQDTDVTCLFTPPDVGERREQVATQVTEIAPLSS